MHLQKLGTPKEGRDAARAGNLAKLFDLYEKHLATPEAREQLDELTAIVRSGRPVCLLCYERDVDHCHRKRIAELICERTGVDGRAPRRAAVLTIAARPGESGDPELRWHAGFPLSRE